jgi:hypothetical protein
MTVEGKLKRLQSYVNERLDLHGDWYGKIQFNKMIEQLQNDIEDGPYWCKHPDENGNKIPMTKVKGSKVMSEEEVEELNKIKLPF